MVTDLKSVYNILIRECLNHFHILTVSKYFISQSKT